MENEITSKQDSGLSSRSLNCSTAAVDENAKRETVRKMFMLASLIGYKEAEIVKLNEDIDRLKNEHRQVSNTLIYE